MQLDLPNPPRVGAIALQALARDPGQPVIAPEQLIPLPVVGPQSRERYKLRCALRWKQPRKRQRRCGRVAIDAAVTIGEGWIHGTESCGSVWACPVCSAKIRAERAGEVGRAVDAWIEHHGGSVGMLTLTVRHRRGADLAWMLHGLSDAWRRLTQGRVGQLVRQQWSHAIRGVDVTLGEHGWHPHLHVLLFVGRDQALDRDLIASRWAQCVAEVLGENHRPLESSVGVHWSRNHRKSDYLLHLGLEVTSDSKLAAQGSVSVWDVARLVADGVSQHPWFCPSLAWNEWVSATFRRRHLTWSRGARALMRELPERPAEYGERDLSRVTPQFVARIENGTWAQLIHCGALRPILVSDVLDWSRAGEAELKLQLEQHGYSLEFEGLSDTVSAIGECISLRLLAIVYDSAFTRQTLCRPDIPIPIAEQIGNVAQLPVERIDSALDTHEWNQSRSITLASSALEG